MGRKLALIRGVNVGGRVLPMAELREVCAGLGWRNVRTFIQSGNVIFESDEGAAALEAALEAAITERFGYRAPVIVRTPAQWVAYPAGNPFPEAARDQPKGLMLLVSKRPPAENAVDALQARATMGERVGRAGDGLWIWFREGVARPKLSPVLIDKLVDSPATSRNFRTVTKLREMLEE
jgi:uncharacterized protein (DUF1697 family)